MAAAAGEVASAATSTARESAAGAAAREAATSAADVAPRPAYVSSVSANIAPTHIPAATSVRIAAWIVATSVIAAPIARAIPRTGTDEDAA